MINQSDNVLKLNSINRRMFILAAAKVILLGGIVSRLFFLQVKENKIKKQTKEINQNKLDQEEFEFLKLNLLYSAKCQKSVFKKGYEVGTPEYKNCILKKGRE